MFKKANKDVNPENVGIMQGFADMLGEEELSAIMGSEEKDMDTATMKERTPKSPEILMNNLRGDMRSIDARVEELADLVGYNAAASTPPEVLALLQPVLAAEAQQGIGALPAAGMGQPPQGMPPNLPGGAPTGMPMPPPAAAPSEPPPMDMPPVPNTTPAGMPAGGIETLNMAKGGIVQRFQAGSGEAGVTPVDDPASFLGLGGSYPPELINEARAKTLEFLSKRPLQTPDLGARTAERVPLYEKLLGYDKGAAQAQALLDIGRAGFNLAANVDEQGQPLRGSFASRFSRSVAPIPGRLAERIAEKSKMEQGVRLAAVQASEKEIADIREQNLKLLEQQRQGWQAIAKGTTSSMFGSGKEGRVMDFMVKFAPGYAKGTTTPQEDRIFEAAVNDYTQPRIVQYIDPDTQNVMTRTERPELPDFVSIALENRIALGGGTPAPAPAKGDKGKKGGTVVRTVPPSMQDRPASVTDQGAAAPAPVADQTAAPPTDQAPPIPAVPNYVKRDALTVRPQLQSYFTNAQPTMFGAAGRGTGTPSAIASFFYKTPLVGPSLPFASKEASEARDYLENSVNRINSALATSPRFAETERQQIQQQLNLLPKLWDNPTAYRSRLFTLDDYLIRLQEQAIETAFETAESLPLPARGKTVINEKVPAELRRQAREKAIIIHGVRENIGSPLRIYSNDDPRLKLVPKGTPFLWNNQEWRLND